MKMINPAVEVCAHIVRLDSANGLEVLSGSQVVVDALDNVKDRLTLEALARSMGVPFVHGALAGFEGQIITVFPEDPGLKQIYGNGAESGSAANRPEFLLGVPSITPSLVATLEAMEVLKILLNRGTPFRNKMVYIDLEKGEWTQFALQVGQEEEQRVVSCHTLSGSRSVPMCLELCASIVIQNQAEVRA
jgi:molybdopterin/thiamine biosynthesis adenylyltransferase